MSDAVKRRSHARVTGRCYAQRKSPTPRERGRAYGSNRPETIRGLFLDVPGQLGRVAGLTPFRCAVA